VSRLVFTLPGAVARHLRRLSGIGETELVPQAKLSGPMPWVIAIMVALTVIAAAAGLALRNAGSAAAEELAGGVTVQVVEASPESRERQRAAILAELEQTSGVVSVRSAPQAETDALVEPWLGRAASAGGSDMIPIPALIDVRLDGAVTPERVAALQRSLRAVAPAARVDAQSSWLEPVFAALGSLQWLAIALVLLLAAALAAAVLLAARTALGVNRSTIEIVHLLGGTDAQIAGVFQRSIGLDAAGGGAVGMLLAVVVILFLGRRFGSLGAGLVSSGALGLVDWLLLALVPVAAAALAMATARLTVIHALRKML
jgi:cell division transport system permease protein